MAKRYLTASEIDHVARRAHLGTPRRARYTVPADAPATKVVDVLVDKERITTALASHLGPRLSGDDRHYGYERAKRSEDGTGQRELDHETLALITCFCQAAHPADLFEQLALAL